jgi:membrane protease YdiL (CAAX protease family)
VDRKLGWIVLMLFLWFLPNLITPIFGNLFKVAGVGTSRWAIPSLKIVMMGVLIYPLIEELVFRGCIQGSLSGLLPCQIWLFARIDLAVILMSFIFALWHFDITQPNTIKFIPFALHFLGGISLGILRNQTGAIWPGVFVHVLGNALSIFQKPS